MRFYLSRTFFGLLLLQALPACSYIDDVLDITPPDDETDQLNLVRFVAIGDTGTGNTSQYQVARAIENKCQQSGCDFVLLLGDNVYPDGVDSVEDDQFQTKFELPYQLLDLPFYAVLGNHDYGGNGAGFEISKSLYQIKYTEVSSKWNMPRHYYHFQKQHVSFFALDTNAQMFGVVKKQKPEVSDWISQAQTPWKIAFGHHPYKSNGPHGNAGRYEGIAGIPIVSGDHVKDFAESVWCGKVDVYISGHDHSRQWLQPTCDGTELVVSGAGSKTTDLPGDNPVRFQADTIGFLYVTIDGKTLDAEFLDADGNIQFNYRLQKTVTQTAEH